MAADPCMCGQVQLPGMLTEEHLKRLEFLAFAGAVETQRLFAEALEIICTGPAKTNVLETLLTVGAVAGGQDEG
jgi:hypothetical protein